MKIKIDISKEKFAEWLDALRSGDFKQGDSYLKRMNGGVMCHCCLGVLCEVMGFEQIQGDNGTVFIYGGKEETEVLPFGSDNFYSKNFKKNGALPNRDEWTPELVKKYSGKSFGYAPSLTELNDSGEFTFTEIAEIIEDFFDPNEKL